ncbi:hypothetical protein VP01_52g3 [Puccinia sorghi]|uniref:Uncharacterized protein n=1 Tax=Puccinia sorghi TaxID=27349 RepID=A0A0L6UKA4_9BASI|nr:hypothetical protein VP01_52g3 [Puccinia sorghi]
MAALAEVLRMNISLVSISTPSELQLSYMYAQPNTLKNKSGKGGRNNRLNFSRSTGEEGDLQKNSTMLLNKTFSYTLRRVSTGCLNIKPVIQDLCLLELYILIKILTFSTGLVAVKNFDGFYWGCNGQYKAVMALTKFTHSSAQFSQDDLAQVNPRLGYSYTLRMRFELKQKIIPIKGIFFLEENNKQKEKKPYLQCKISETLSLENSQNCYNFQQSTKLVGGLNLGINPVDLTKVHHSIFHFKKCTRAVSMELACNYLDARSSIPIAKRAKNFFIKIIKYIISRFRIKASKIDKKIILTQKGPDDGLERGMSHVEPWSASNQMLLQKHTLWSLYRRGGVCGYQQLLLLRTLSRGKLRRAKANKGKYLQSFRLG